MVGLFIDEPPARWDCPGVGKLPGLQFALGSEFFRNLGWNGFKPDRHVIRLLNGLVGELVNQQASSARLVSYDDTPPSAVTAYGRVIHRGENAAAEPDVRPDQSTRRGRRGTARRETKEP